MTTFRWGGASDVGRVRAVNQDSWYATDGLYVVADGMGGHQGGEVASLVAVEAIRDHVDEPAMSSVLEGFRVANAAIIDRGIDVPELRGMGTTVVAVVAVDTEDGPRLAVANVGDSRAYVFAGDSLRQITQDHSLVESLVREGRLTPEEAEIHPQRNIVTRALGVAPDVEIDWWQLPVRAGDRFVLCSDGLFNEVTADQIAAVLRRLADPSDAADELVRVANEHGGRDNITVLVVDVEPDDAAPGTSAAVGQVGDPRVTHLRSDIAGFGTAGLDELDSTHDYGDTDRDDPPAPEDDGRRQLVSGRTVGWAFAVVVVVVLAVIAVGIYARASYFVAVDGEQIVIYQGRPGGVLWFDPTLEEVTGVDIADLTPALLEEVAANPTSASLDSARDYVDGVVERIPDRGAEPTPTPEG